MSLTRRSSSRRTKRNSSPAWCCRWTGGRAGGSVSRAMIDDVRRTGGSPRASLSRPFEDPIREPRERRRTASSPYTKSQTTLNAKQKRRPYGNFEKSFLYGSGRDEHWIAAECRRQGCQVSAV